MFIARFGVARSVVARLVMGVHRRSVHNRSVRHGCSSPLDLSPARKLADKMDWNAMLMKISCLSELIITLAKHLSWSDFRSPYVIYYEPYKNPSLAKLDKLPRVCIFWHENDGDMLSVAQCLIFQNLTCMCAVRRGFYSAIDDDQRSVCGHPVWKLAIGLILLSVSYSWCAKIGQNN